MKTVEQVMNDLGFENTTFEGVMVRKTEDVRYYSLIVEDEEYVTIVEVQPWEFEDLEEWELDCQIEMTNWSVGMTLTQYLMRVK